MSQRPPNGGDQPRLVDQLDGLSLNSDATTCTYRSRCATDFDGAKGRGHRSYDISQSACDVRMRRGLEANARNHGDGDGNGAGDGPRGCPSMTSSAVSKASGGCSNGPTRNYSFTRTQLRDIERSNQILVQRICTSKPSDAVQRSVSTTNLLNHIAPATINRRRQQQQIDAGNEVMQKRLARIAQRRRSTTNK